VIERRGLPAVGMVGRGAKRPRLGLIHQDLAGLKGSAGTLSRHARVSTMGAGAGLL
jgi:hypothetical protein